MTLRWNDHMTTETAYVLSLMAMAPGDTSKAATANGIIARAKDEAQRAYDEVYQRSISEQIMHMMSRL